MQSRRAGGTYRVNTRGYAMSSQNGDRHTSDIQPSKIQPEQLTAYALGQLHGEELAAVKAAIGEGGDDGRGSQDPTQRLTEGLGAAPGDLRSGTRRGQETCAEQVREVQALAAAVSRARNAEPLPATSVELRAAIESKLAQLEVVEKVEPAASQRRWRRPSVVEWVVMGGIGVLLIGLSVPAVQMSRNAARQMAASNSLKQLRADLEVEKALSSSGIKRQILDPASESDKRDAFASTSPSTTTGDDMTLMVTPRATREQDGIAWRMSVTGPRAAEQYEWSAPRVAAEQDEPHNLAINPKTTGSPEAAGQSAGYKVAVPATEAPPSASYSGLIPSGNVPANSSGAGYGGGAPLAGGGQAGGSPGGRAMNGSGAARGSGGYGYGGGERYPGELAGAMPGSGISGQRRSFESAPPGTANGNAADLAEIQKLNENLALSQRTAGGAEGGKFQNQLEREAAEHGVRVSQAEYELAFRMRAEQKGRLFADGEQVGSEQYEPIAENAFLSPLSDPLSTFSIDVDTASYANVRRFLNEGRLPPPSAVRIEELVNYFTYSYPQPSGREPFSVNMEAAECPWNAGHLLLRVGLKGKEVHRSERPPSNLTFLLDVSGSMADANKLPLLKTTLMMFVAELTENDRVSIVTYAGEAGLRLPPTRGHEKEKIMAAIDSLSAGGSTHGSAGIQLAYEQAAQYFLKDGTNRVILATDGDLNVGITSDDALVQLIKEKAASGTFLTVLGFGTGNLKDGKLEKLADNGNGVYAYIDGVREGRKVLVEQMSENLVTIAKDVKIQIEFNPAQIASYRLLGYENRVLAAADFNNDKKDAGEIGAGHTVTALYELVPVGAKQEAAAPHVGEPLKYQGTGARSQEPGAVGPHGAAVGSSALRGVPGAERFTEAAASGELLTLKLRFKEPDGVESRMIEFPLKERGGQFSAASKDLQFAAAVASFGMILRGSEHRGSGNLAAVAEIAGGAIDTEPNGYRAEFVDLVRKAQALGAR